MLHFKGFCRIFTIVVLGLALIVFCSCRKTERKTGVEELVSSSPDQEIWDAEVVFTHDQRVTSILQAPRLVIYEQAGLTIADSSFQLDLFNIKGEHTSVLTADSGVVKGEDTLIAIGNVVVISDSGVVIETERLFWDKANQLVRSDTAVKLTTETDTLYGDGLISDDGLNNWEIFNPRGKTVREINRKSESKSPK